MFVNPVRGSEASAGTRLVCSFVSPGGQVPKLRPRCSGDRRSLGVGPLANVAASFLEIIAEESEESARRPPPAPVPRNPEGEAAALADGHGLRLPPQAHRRPTVPVVGHGGGHFPRRDENPQRRDHPPAPRHLRRRLPRHHPGAHHRRRAPRLLSLVPRRPAEVVDAPRAHGAVPRRAAHGQASAPRHAQDRLPRHLRCRPSTR